MESSGCKSRTAKASMQAGSECCHSPGDWWVRSVHCKEAGREDSAPKIRLVAMPTPLTRRTADIAFGLTLHPEKTRLVDFGRYAEEHAKRQGKKPATFDFLGFTHICGVGAAMVDLNGHEAGNGGYSQGTPTAHRHLSYSERWTAVILDTLHHFSGFVAPGLQAGILGSLRAAAISGVFCLTL